MRDLPLGATVYIGTRFSLTGLLACMFPGVTRYRRRTPLLLLVSSLVLPSALARAQSQLAYPPFPSEISFLGVSSHRDRLSHLVSLAADHQVGTDDKAVASLGSWSDLNLRDAVMEIVLVQRWLAAHPIDANLNDVPDAKNANEKAIRIRKDIRDLLHLADDEVKTGNLNRVLKRSAALFLDAGKVHLPGATPDDSHGDALTYRTTSGAVSINAVDGQARSYGNFAAYFDGGRRLLGGVVPSPAKDETVRLWYLTAGAFLRTSGALSEGRRNAAAALLAFAQDGDMMFMAGCVHESMASPRVQASVQTARVALPVNYRLDVQPASNHLRQAEEYLASAVRAAPDSAERLVHLGRVKGLRGRHEEAARDLRAALKMTTDLPLLYFAHLFLGAEEEALGNREAARNAYERAAEIAPPAQSPYLALSRLAAEAGNRAEAGRAMEHIWQVDLLQDPWWVYHYYQSRRPDEVYARFKAAFSAGEAR